MNVYLDHAAATPVSSDLFALYQKATELGWANPASVHILGQKARGYLDEARDICPSTRGELRADYFYIGGHRK
jgi:cysteine desulfurase